MSQGVSVAIAVDVEENDASKSKYEMILGCLNNNANLAGGIPSNVTQQVNDCGLASGHH